MPDLPEIETIRRGLEKEAVGKRVKSAELTGTKAIHRNGTKKAFQARVEGAKVKSVDRKGRHLVAVLDSGDVLVLDLGDHGQLLRATPKEPTPKHTQVILTFTQGGQLRYVDPKISGEMFIVESARLAEEVPEIAARGVDPVGEPVSWTAFAQRVIATDGKLKSVLLDPNVVVGIGGLYADEICFEAGLRPDRATSSLSAQEIRRLFRALVETLHEAVKHRGTTTDDHPFTDVYGKPGEFQLLLQVYGRDGESCRRCRNPVSKMRLGNRTTYLCESCQV